MNSCIFLKPRTFLGLLPMLASTFAIMACSSSHEGFSEVTREYTTDNAITYENAADVPGAYTQVSEEVMQEKEKVRLALDEQLNSVDQKLEQLDDQAKALGDTTKQTYTKVADQLDDEREELVAEYKRLENASDVNWQGIKYHIEETMLRVEQNIKELTASLDR